MQVNKHPVEQEEVMAYLDGELTADRKAFVVAHINECGECQRLVAEFRDVSRQLASWEVVVPDAQPPSMPRRIAVWKWAAIVAAACLLVVLVVAQNTTNRRHAQRDYFRADSLMEYRPIRGPMIARTSQLVLIAKEFDKARGALEDIVKRHRGYVGQLNVASKEGEVRRLEAILRVPADQLEPTLAEIKKMGQVDSESQNGEEVTQQYIDLDARLTNAQNTERRLTAILHDRTGKMSEVLAVETEIDRVRGEIERMEIEKKALVNRVDFTTLSVSLREASKAQLPPHGTWDQIQSAAADGYASLTDGVVGITTLVLSYGPSFLLWGGLAVFAIRFARRRFRKVNELLKFGRENVE